MDAREIGSFGEKLAYEYLVNKGYRILGKNCKYFCGEIDIVAKKKGIFGKKPIHFIEIKTSLAGNNNFFPEQRAGFTKQQKYKKLSEIWLLNNKIPENTPYQIDIVAILIKDNPEITFFENILSES
jgi:putative endonuclease